jgi:hypothetical protein
VRAKGLPRDPKFDELRESAREVFKED